MAKNNGDGSMTALASPPEASPSAASPSRAGLSDPNDWVEQHGDYLFRYALIRVRNESVAEDLVQDTLLAVFQGKERFSSQSTERGWLTGILRHKILDHFRRLNRERTVGQEETWPDEPSRQFDDLGRWQREPDCGPSDWGADAATLMERKEFMAALKDCLAKLPPRSAEAFILREMEGVDSEDIQEIMGVTPANFWVLLHRARMQLRCDLERNWLTPHNRNARKMMLKPVRDLGDAKAHPPRTCTTPRLNGA